jgi:O6-methylguanine-DNA--protein-cysteine methyltransferase
MDCSSKIAFSSETFNTQLTHLATWGKSEMIEVYAQNIDQTWFAIAQKSTSRRIFVWGKPTDIDKKSLRQYPSTMPSRFSTNPQPSQTGTRNFKSMYDGKDITNLSLAINHLPTYTKSPENNLNSPIGYVTLWRNRKSCRRRTKAVGNVMASNPFAPIVPCHRVVRRFSLGGYGFGLKAKMDLLGRESEGFFYQRS